MTLIPTRYEALLTVRAHFETQQDMADFFGVTQPTIWRWLNQTKQLPAQFVLRAEARTGVSRHHLRPDIYPVDLAPAPTFIGVHDRSDDIMFGPGAPRYGKRTDVLDSTPGRRAVG